MEKVRNVLVIGGNRYVGKRLIARLRDEGHRVTVLNRGILPAMRPGWSIWWPTGTTSGR